MADLKKLAEEIVGLTLLEAAELKKIYDGLNTQLIKERRETEITAFFAAFAAALAVLAAGLSMLWFNRIL